MSEIRDEDEASRWDSALVLAVERQTEALRVQLEEEEQRTVYWHKRWFDACGGHGK